jgi:hypothetical protein
VKAWAEMLIAEATHTQRGLVIPDEKTPVMKDVREHLKKLQRSRTKTHRATKSIGSSTT